MIPVRPRSVRSRLARRDFLRVAPAGLAAGMLPVAASTSQRAAPGTSTDPLACAQSLADLQFTRAEHELMMALVARNRRRYGQLRQLQIPVDTEPAFAYRPYRSGGRLTGRATPHAALPVSRTPAVVVPSNLEELAFQPVTALAQLLERRAVTSTDLTRMYIARLKRFGDSAQLRRHADRRARARAGGRSGPRDPSRTLPRPIARDPMGSEGPLRDQRRSDDVGARDRTNSRCSIWTRRLWSGCARPGRSSWPSCRWERWRAVRSGMAGRRGTRETSRTSSGSSAGPGAATAAGLVGFSLGTETLGSIISPSAACGVVGLRPTYGRVSRYGAMTVSWTMDKIGPMCRTVEDCVVAFNAIYGPDGKDDTVVDAPFTWDTDLQPSRLRVGYVASEFERPPDNATLDERRVWEQEVSPLRDALDTLRGVGITVEPVELPAFPADTLRLILDAEAATAFDDLTRSRGVDRLTQQGPDGLANSFRASRFIPAVEYIRAQRARTLLGREMDALMTRYDAFVSSASSASLTMTNLTGHPALALKAGFRDGMPVALMVTGRVYDETTVLQIGLAFERATGWHTMHPQLT